MHCTALHCTACDAHRIRERKLVKARREYVARRALNSAVRAWARDSFDPGKRDALAALSPAKYTRLFYRQEKAAAKVRGCNKAR